MDEPAYFVRGSFVVRTDGVRRGVSGEANRGITLAEKKRDRSAVIVLIAIFKLLKAVALLCVGIGAFRLAGKDLNETLERWANSFRVDPHNKYLQELLSHSLHVSKDKLRFVGVATFIYAGMFGTEGVGLMLGKRWAEYMTILTTSLLLPLEIYEICHHSNWVKVATLVINALAVIYLIVRVWKMRKDEAAQGMS